MFPVKYINIELFFCRFAIPHVRPSTPCGGFLKAISKSFTPLSYVIKFLIANLRKKLK